MDDDLEIKAYYAGHVLGAAMFQIRVGQSSVVYTVCFYFPCISFLELCPLAYYVSSIGPRVFQSLLVQGLNFVRYGNTVFLFPLNK